MKNKICVYTCITGDYDELKNIVFEKNVDYYCFTNNLNIKSNNWKVVYIKNKGLDNIRLARKIKILGHPLLKKYDINVWIDGSIYLKDLFGFLNNECDLKNYSYCGIIHEIRKCIYEEIDACKKYGKGNIEEMDAQIDYYKKMGFPQNYGLHDTCIIVRKRKKRILNKTMKMWFENVNKYSTRDQLSHMWCVYNMGLKVQTININKSFNKYFKCINHNNAFEKNKYKVYFERKIGEGFNEDDSKTCEYQIDDNNLYKKKGKFVIPFDCKNLRIDPTDVCHYAIKKISLNGINKKFSTNCLKYDKLFISLNDDPNYIYKSDFKKGDIIELEVEFVKLELDFYLDMVNKKIKEIEYLNECITNMEKLKKEVEKE